MGEWQRVAIGTFLTERETRCKPDDKSIQNLKRLDKIDFNGIIHLSDKPTKTDMIIVCPGDIVISGINVAKGALAVWEGTKSIKATIHYSSYSFDPAKIHIAFFKRYLKSPVFIRALKEQVKGGIKTEIKAKQLLPLIIELPSLPEQKIIDQHFKSFEDELLELTNENNNQSVLITKLRQTILQEAVEGKLTVEWRKDNPIRSGNPEYDGAALLAQIKAEKQKMIDAGKIKKEKPLAPIKPEEVPFVLPEGWVWTRLGETGNLKRGKSKHRPRNDGILFEDGIYPFVQTGDVSNAKYNKNLIVTTNNFYNKLGLKQSEMQKEGTLCITIAANIAECGFLNFNACVPDSIVCFSSINKNIDKYVFYFIRISKDHLERFAPATAQKNINLGILDNLIFPLPPLAEQRVIIERVENILAIVDELEAQAKERKTQSGELVQAVLWEAFESAKHTIIESITASSIQNNPDKSITSFQQMQIVGAVIDEINRVNQHQGEMIIAKYLYILEAVYKIKTGFKFQKWHFGPYDPKLKKIINNRTYFTQSGKNKFKTFNIQNTDKLFKYHNNQVDEIRKNFPEILEIFKAYKTSSDRDYKIELLACVLKVIEGIEMPDIDVVYSGFKEWPTDKQETGFSSKAEKFTRSDVEKCLEFVKNKKWI